MMSNQSFRVFISAVSSEFEQCRNELALALRKKGLEVRDQQCFTQGAGTLLQRLGDYIKDCHAVIFLVGRCCGSTPAPEHARRFERLPVFKEYRDGSGNPSASYSQWEYLLAKHYRKDTYFFIASDEFHNGCCSQELADRAQMQQNYIQWVKRQGKHYDSIANREQLIRDVLVLGLPTLIGDLERPVRHKGLYSYGPDDADYFLDLVPGQRRDGLPVVVADWKRAIERTDPFTTFRVGMMYGPSGCGKSSLIKAGILPTLSTDVKHFCIDATADTTEVGILQKIRRMFRDLSAELNLAESLAAVARMQRPKLLIVIDQFEQWLRVHRGETDTALGRALSHCDGLHLQCLILVRQEFFLEAKRFLEQLGVRITEGETFAVIDLFSKTHAKMVLTKFGKSFQRLPDDSSHITDDENRFLDDSIEQLATDDRRVAPVRLALFAEMVKDDPWCPQTLSKYGGAQGIGKRFLIEKLASRDAPEHYRRHSKAAMQFLEMLLPEEELADDQDMDIKKYEAESTLRQNSLYASRPAEFKDLTETLNKLRLITVTDPHRFGTASEASDVRPSANRETYYQLTHDFLVPSVREWLDEDKTWRGRARKLLKRRGAQYRASPERRNLPAWWEFLGIGILTNWRTWTAPQRKVMWMAAWHHGAIVVTTFALLVLISWAAWEARGRIQAEAMVQTIYSASPAELERLLDTQLPPLRRWANATLQRVANDPTAEPDQRLRASLASLADDPSQIGYLNQRILDCSIDEFGVIRNALARHTSDDDRSAIVRNLWHSFREPQEDTARRFRAGMALAGLDAASQKWNEDDAKTLTGMLLNSNPDIQRQLRTFCKPVASQLLQHMEAAFRDEQARESVRLAAANAVVQYTRDVNRLVGLLVVGTPEQYAVLYPVISAAPTPATLTFLRDVAAAPPPEELGATERVSHGQRRANAAVTLMRLGKLEQVPPLFEVADDPEALTQFIYRCRTRGVGIGAVLDCLRLSGDTSTHPHLNHARYALLLALGEFTLDEVPESRRERLIKQLAQWYRDDPSSGIHGAVGWLLRQWGQSEIVRAVDQTSVPYLPGREWFTEAITVVPNASTNPNEDRGENVSSTERPLPANDPTSEHTEVTSVNEASEKEKTRQQMSSVPSSELVAEKTFYFTFIVFPAGEYAVGSVEDEPNRSPQQGREQRHTVRVSRPFAVLDREITFDELLAFSLHFADTMRQGKAQPEHAGFGSDWYNSVAFCRWLGEQKGLTEFDQPYADPKTLDVLQYAREADPRAKSAPRNWPLQLGRAGIRLPTESEWEIAARGGVRTAFGYGGDLGLLDRYGWFDKNSGNHAHRPRELRPNFRGLFDMHGNLWEWTHDWYDVFASPVLQDPTGPAIGSDRVIRGGSWNRSAASCRSADRSTSGPANFSFNGGFRLARTLEE